jgi:hypothetical protein
MTGVVRFLGLKKKLHWDQDPSKSKYSSYTCRHTFAHRMLSGYWSNGAGCSIETLAELIGDTPKVAFDHYGKEWGQHYQDPLWAALGAGTKAEVASPVPKPGTDIGSRLYGKPSRKPSTSRANRPGQKSSAKKSAHLRVQRNHRRQEEQQ